MPQTNGEKVDDEIPLTRYSDAGFFGRSVLFGIILSALTWLLTDASGWQAWTVTGFCLFVFVTVSIQQATVIENAVFFFFVAVIVSSVSTAEQFGFHWSVLIVAALAAINAMGGRESCQRHRYRVAYGDEAYRKRYRNN